MLDTKEIILTAILGSIIAIGMSIVFVFFLKIASVHILARIGTVLRPIVRAGI